MRAMLLSTVVLLLAQSAILAAEPEPPQTQRQRLAKLTEEISREVEKLRGRRFDHPVKTDFVARDQVGRKLLADLAEEYPDEKLRADEAFLKTIGALPPGTDLKGTFIDVMSSQIGAYYDPKTRTFYVVEDVAKRYGPLPLAVIIAHELTHALDDQKFDLKRLFDSAKDDEDRSFAVGSVGEGAATVLMNQYLAQELSKHGSVAFGLAIFSAASLVQDRDAMEKLVRAPRYFHTIVAHYTAGEAFLRYGAVGPDEDKNKLLAAAMDRAMSQPPVSSEQILHPGKYWSPAERDEPVIIESKDMKAILAAAGLRIAHEQTAGELLCALVTERGPSGLLTSQWTNIAAAGWGGDRFYLVEPIEKQPVQNGAETERKGAVWVVAWDTPVDRGEFFAAYRTSPDGSKWQRIDLGNRAAAILFNLNGPQQLKMRELLEKSPPKFTRSGKPWTSSIGSAP